MTFAQDALNFEAVDTHYEAVVALVSTDWRADPDFVKFVDVLRASVRGEFVSQNDVRLCLLEDTVKGPRCSIEHHRYSAFFSRACKHGLIVKARREDGEIRTDTCTTSPSGNNGKQQTLYRWTGGAV